MLRVLQMVLQGTGENRQHGISRRLTDFESEHFDWDNVTPDRPRTAFFKPTSYMSADELFDALEKDKFPPSSIKCLQRRPSGEVLVTFISTSWRDSFLKHSSFIEHKRASFIGDRDRSLVFLTIYDAPFELPDRAIDERLKEYGCEVIRHRRGRYQGHRTIHNGLRHFQVRLERSLPSYLRFGKFLVRLSYPGQKPTCRKCNSKRHLAADCPNIMCYNCENVGHHARDCPEDRLCCICKSRKHVAKACPFSWYRKPSDLYAASEPLYEDLSADDDQASNASHTSTVNLFGDDDASDSSHLPGESQPLITVLHDAPVSPPELGDSVSDSALIDAAASQSILQPPSDGQPLDSAISDSVPDSVLLAADQPVDSQIPASISDSALLAADQSADSPIQDSLADSVLVTAVESDVPVDRPPADELPANVPPSEVPVDHPPSDELPVNASESVEKGKKQKRKKNANVSAQTSSAPVSLQTSAQTAPEKTSEAPKPPRPPRPPRPTRRNPAPVFPPPEIAFGRRATRPSRVPAPRSRKQRPSVVVLSDEEMELAYCLKRKPDDQTPGDQPEDPGTSKRAAT